MNIMKTIEEGIFPSDLNNMKPEELEQLCSMLRKKIINTVSETGGHLASNLGIIELTVALHKVFNAPRDKIVWDVGHQTYVHKMLTGRGNRFESLRQKDGLSGFPKRDESEYDTFDSGHSSNSISVALGMAVARDREGLNNSVVAVIGDGAMTGGMAFEALNNAGDMNTDIIIVLNDNAMSISKNRGGLSKHLAKLRTSDRYKKLKTGLKSGLGKIPGVGQGVTKGLSTMRDMVKYLIVPGIMFEEMGLTYMGPVDGHNVAEMVEALEAAKRAGGPVLVHCITQKGRGYSLSENSPEKYHGVGPFNTEIGIESNVDNPKTFSEVFGSKLCAMATRDNRITVVTAAMTDGTGLSRFARQFPEKIYDVGIAEEHAVSFAAGMALCGMRPFVAIYSTFLQRAYDQILMDVCMQNLPVIFAIDRAGIVGEDGETHQGIFDLSYLMHMPNLTILAPSDGAELRRMMDYAMIVDGPVAIRYPKGKASMPEESISVTRVPEQIGPEVRVEGEDLTVLAVGKMTRRCIKAAEALKEKGISVEVIDVRKVKPLDTEVIERSARKTHHIITVEDNVTSGGFGSEVEDLAENFGFAVKIKKIGWPDEFIPHGKQKELEEQYGLDALGLARRFARASGKVKASVTETKPEGEEK